MSDAKRIFLIDDERDITELVGALLRYSGFEVETSNEPEEALRRLKEERFDAVVIDLMMTPMDGFSVIKSLRSLPANSQAAVFALSSRMLSEEERKFLIEHGIHFISKPIPPRQFVDKIREKIQA